MKLVGELKNKVEKTENINEAKELIKNAGMELSDEEMDQVAGGTNWAPEAKGLSDGLLTKPRYPSV